MQHYYHAFSQTKEEAEKKIEYVENEILPFKQYIDTAIKTLENKKVKARWQKVEADFNATLVLKGYLYEYDALSHIKLDNEFYRHLDSIIFLQNIPNNPDYDEKLIVVLENNERIKISLKNGDIAQGCMALYKLCNISYEQELDSICDIKNNGFIHLDSLQIDDYEKKKLTDNTIKKVSWNGDDIYTKTLKEWFGGGQVELDSKQASIKGIENNKILLDINTNKASIIQKDGFLLPASLESNHIQDNHKVLIDGRPKIIYCSNKVENPLYKQIKKTIDYIDYCDFKSLCDENENKIDIEKKDFNKVWVKNIKKLDKITLHDKNQVLYTLEKNNSEQHYIKLLSADEIDDEYEIESPLRFFLDSDITISAKLEGYGEPQECRARIVNRDEFNIILTHKNRPVIPIKDSLLETKPNLYTLKCQKHAIENLIKMPLAQSHTLLKLFASRKKDKINWLTQDFEKIDIAEWEVLTDGRREGADIQRKFIQQALATKDFAILEGPPGSGKTTTILELIAQIIKKNERVLLCGSTHIAIDNVLERLKEKKLIEKLNIFPIRVGSEGALSDEVSEFRLGDFNRNYENSLLEKYRVYDDLESKKHEGIIDINFFMQCANLVCGTTIGILQYPAFKLRDEKNKTPIISEFDYLIIDESSKTTFQEFLVPAIYAKKWIIVGDTRQLSPFVDKDELADNIKNLPLHYNKINKKFDCLESKYQEACTILFLLAKIYKDNNYDIKIAMGLSRDVLEIIKQEIEIRKKEKRDTFGVLNNGLEVEYITSLQKFSYFHNLSKHWIFYDRELIEKNLLKDPLKSLIPSDFIDFSNLSLLYQYRNKDKKLKFDNKNKDRDLESFLKVIKDYKKERQFASEIAWRLSREFELRTFGDCNINKQTQRYTKAIDELLPKSHKDRNIIRNKISTIANIALPSILESLIKGVSDRRTNREDSAIRSGFTEKELESRHSILSTQGRMHPDISSFPREQFYKESSALQDLSSLNRSWNYERYKKRSVWIDAKEGKGIRGKNEEEAKILIKELEAFIKFASKNKHPLNETWSVAVLSFYKGQTRILESKLQDFTEIKYNTTNFTKKWDGTTIQIKLCSVDRFQGQEADIVFLSMVNTDKIGFLDNPNRLNVGITRAKFQLVIIGNYKYFDECNNDMLQKFAKSQLK